MTNMSTLQLLLGEIDRHGLCHRQSHHRRHRYRHRHRLCQILHCLSVFLSPLWKERVLRGSRCRRALTKD